MGPPRFIIMLTKALSCAILFHFSLNFLTMPRFCKMSLHFKVSYQFCNALVIFRYALPVSWCLWPADPIMYSAVHYIIVPSSVNSFPLRSKHYPLHSVLAHPQSISPNLLEGVLVTFEITLYYMPVNGHFHLLTSLAMVRTSSWNQWVDSPEKKSIAGGKQKILIGRFATVAFYLAAVTVLRILLSGKLCLGNLIAMYQGLEWTSTLSGVQAYRALYISAILPTSCYWWCTANSKTLCMLKFQQLTMSNIMLVWTVTIMSCEVLTETLLNSQFFWRIVILDPEDEGITFHRKNIA